MGTRRQVLLAMARNLSIGTRCIEDSEGEKSAKKCSKLSKNAQKKCYNLHTSRELVSPVCLSPSCLQADWCLQGTPSNSDEHLLCRQLQINLRAIFTYWISWNSLWPLRIMIYFIWATFQKFLESEVDFFITTNFQTVVRGAQGHPTGNMISRFVPWPINYSFFCFKTPEKLLGCL